jgi:ParB/RepB/Spo0J family partition protein
MPKEIIDLALDDLVPHPEHVRQDFGDLDGLTNSARDDGIKDPIHVVALEGKFAVYDGWRRVEAARGAGHPTIPAIVDEVSGAEAKRLSLKLNLLHKKLTVHERVAAYQDLMNLHPAWGSIYALAKAIDQPHQLITQDFQKVEMAARLQAYGISLASQLQPGDERRQRGEAVPEYHAVLLYQALPYLAGDDGEASATTGNKMAVLARRIAPMSQSAAKAYIAAVKDGVESLDADEPEWQQGTSVPVRHDSTSATPTDLKTGAPGTSTGLRLPASKTGMNQAVW